MPKSKCKRDLSANLHFAKVHFKFLNSLVGTPLVLKMGFERLVNALEDATEGAVDDAVEDAVDDAVGEAVEDAVDAQADVDEDLGDIQAEDGEDARCGCSSSRASQTL